MTNTGMVDISAKEITKRIALATATISFSPEAMKEFVENGSPKGNVLETARVSAILAAKATPSIVPLCHPIELNKMSVSFDVQQTSNRIVIQAEVACTAKTGAEMEALTAVTVAALTIYDMMKWKDQTMVISDIKLLSKTGGKSGDYKRQE